MPYTRTAPDWIACPTCDGAGGYSPTGPDDLGRFARTDTRTPRELLEAAYGELDRFGPVARSMLADKVAATPSGAELLRRAEAPDTQRLLDAVDAIRKYGSHLSWCQLTDECDCGFVAVLKELPRPALASPSDAAGTVERCGFIYPGNGSTTCGRAADDRRHAEPHTPWGRFHHPFQPEATR